MYIVPCSVDMLAMQCAVYNSRYLLETAMLGCYPLLYVSEREGKGNVDEVPWGGEYSILLLVYHSMMMMMMMMITRSAPYTCNLELHTL